MIRTILAVLGLAALPAGYVVGKPLRVTLQSQSADETDRIAAPPGVSWDTMTLQLVDRDPFRPERQPAPVAFNAVPPEQVIAEPTPPKPVLIVSGIVWGNTPSAVIEGLPGVDGAKLMNPGETIAGITLRRVTSTQVTLRGIDTTWVLTVRKPW